MSETTAPVLETNPNGFLTDAAMAEVAESLRGKRFPLLSRGYIEFIDVMGSDRRIVQAARTTSDLKGKGDLDDRNLLRYLMRHRHTTPIEFCEVCVKVYCPMDAWRQWIRHRTANVNEFSTRYSEVPDAFDATPPEKWRLQSKSNRQGSAGGLGDDFPEGLLVRPTRVLSGSQTVECVTHVGEDSSGHKGWGVYERSSGQLLVNFPELTRSQVTAGLYLSAREEEHHKAAHALYKERIEMGVAKEQARKDLPLATYTVAYWKVDLHNLLHFLSLRMDKHAQLEIRQYATTLGLEIVKPLFPVVWDAFVDYRLEAMTLTRLDIQAIQNIQRIQQGGTKFISLSHTAEIWPEAWRVTPCRERVECQEKMKLLGIIDADVGLNP